jgi:hypothetical protein
VDGAPCHFPISFHSFLIRSVPRTYFSFQSKMREGGWVVTSVVVRFLCGSQWKDLILDLTSVLFVFLLTCTRSDPFVFLVLIPS